LEVVAVVVAATARCMLFATITQKPPNAKKKHHKNIPRLTIFQIGFFFL
jgi:hypothetical protein